MARIWRGCGSGLSCSSDWTRSLGTSMCYGPKKKTGKRNSAWMFKLIMLFLKKKKVQLLLGGPLSLESWLPGGARGPWLHLGPSGAAPPSWPGPHTGLVICAGTGICTCRTPAFMSVCWQWPPRRSPPRCLGVPDIRAGDISASVYPGSGGILAGGPYRLSSLRHVQNLTALSFVFRK